MLSSVDGRSGRIGRCVRGVARSGDPRRLGAGRWRALCAASCSALTLVAFPAPVQAAADQWLGSVAAGPAALRDAKLGPQLALRLGYGLGDYWEGSVQVTGSTHSEAGARRRVGTLAGGFSYRFDVIQWVPYVGLRGGWFSERGAAPRDSGPLAALDYGVDRLLSRNWALGGGLEHTLVFGNQTGIRYHALRLTLTYRFEP